MESELMVNVAKVMAPEAARKPATAAMGRGRKAEATAKATEAVMATVMPVAVA